MGSRDGGSMGREKFALEGELQLDILYLNVLCFSVSLILFLSLLQKLRIVCMQSVFIINKGVNVFDEIAITTSSRLWLQKKIELFEVALKLTQRL